jgi:hypothetical protein
VFPLLPQWLDMPSLYLWGGYRHVTGIVLGRILEVLRDCLAQRQWL